MGSVPTFLRRRPALAAGLLYALMALAFFGQGFLPGRTLSSSDYLWTAAPWRASKPEAVRIFGANGELADAVTQFQPFLQYTRGVLPDVPLWNPHVMAGRPFEANAQSAVFSPFSLPAYVLPFWWSLALIAALKVFVAAFGTYLLARALGMGFAGALAAGVVFGFGLFMVVWLAWPLSSVWAFLPWLLLLTDRLVVRPGPLPAGGLAAVVALQFFGGHPESSFHVLFATLAFFLLRVARARGARLRGTVAFAGAVVGGAALAAVAIVPFLELLGRSADIGGRAGTGLHVNPKYLLAMFISDYWGRPPGTALEGFEVERAFYAGALPLMLVVAGLLLRPTVERVAIAAFGALALAVTVGAPPVFQVVDALPGFSTVHNTRLTILYLMCVALLAGFGLDELVAARPAARRRLMLLVAGAAIVLGPVAFALAGGRVADPAGGLDLAWGFATPPRGVDDATREVVRMGALIVWLTVGGSALALVALRLRRGGLRPGPAVFAGLALALIALDLARAGVGQNPAIPDEHAVQPATGALRYLQSRRPARFAGADPEFDLVPAPANVAMRYGLYDARGYDYPVERRYDRLWREKVAPDAGFAPPTTLAPIAAGSLRALGLLGVADVLQKPTERPLAAPGLRLAYSGPDARVYAHDAALPRAFLVGAQRVVKGEDAALDAVTAPGFDGRTVAVTERALPGVGRDVVEGWAGSARIEHLGRERMRVRATAPRPGVLVLADVHYPGWVASVDGEPAAIERVDYLLRGIALTPGSHRVELRYAPGSWRLGWVVSLAALVVLILAVAAGVGGRRRGPRRAAP